MAQLIMQLFFLGLVIFFFYLIYCIIHTHMLVQENQELLLKLLSIEKKKQKELENMVHHDHSESVQDAVVSDKANCAEPEISIFDHMDNQSF